MNAPLAADWKNAFEEIVAALPDCAQRIYGDRLKALVLFGSVARGTQRPDSDIDLLLVCEPLPPRRLLRIIEFEQLEAALSPCLEAARRRGVYTALSPILRTPAELQAGGFVLLDIPAEGRFLYDREGLARAFFRAPGGMARRTGRAAPPDIRLVLLGAQTRCARRRSHRPRAMTTDERARDYFRRAHVRRAALDLFLRAGEYADVVREAQELVELALKGMRRWAGIDPPRWHDVGAVLLEHCQRFPAALQAQLPTLARLSARLRKEREIAFYGEIDLVPGKTYGREDALAALEAADSVLAALEHCSEHASAPHARTP
ncbi:MAG: HEPN domain-containing protein [Rhodocyclaceae bacterium]|nr:HEPN domain-containing protein [Rhodocyclaceae bacterium]